MSDEYRELERRINRMGERIERLIAMKGEIDSIVAEGNTDIQAMKLQLDAMRYEGDNASN